MGSSEYVKVLWYFAIFMTGSLAVIGALILALCLYGFVMHSGILSVVATG